jgi:hypothetical protein
MTVAEDAVVGDTPGASLPGSAFGSRFGDGFVWYPADPRPRFDPVTAVAIRWHASPPTRASNPTSSCAVSGSCSPTQWTAPPSSSNDEPSPGRCLPTPTAPPRSSNATSDAVQPNVLQNPDGSWSLHALFDDVGGPEFLEGFCWYVDREFDTDWTEATRRLGEGNVDVTKLRRTEGQRRADALLLEPTCIWPGCDQPHTWCHADHLTSWTTRGPTNTHNGAPLCPRHNDLEESGFTVWRDDHGHWHITAPDGTAIC